MLLHSNIIFQLNHRLFRSFSFFNDKFPFRYEDRTEIDTTEKEKPNDRLKALPYPTSVECKNPRSLELLGLARKPSGFQTKKEIHGYFNQVIVECTHRHITASIKHNSGVTLTEATTKEFDIAKHLYRTYDVNAAANIGRVLADRCRIFGIRRVVWDKRKNKEKLTKKKFLAFFEGFKESSKMNLDEPSHSKNYPEAVDIFLEKYQPEGYLNLAGWMDKFKVRQVKVLKKDY